MLLFFFNDTATTEIYTLSLHDALPICAFRPASRVRLRTIPRSAGGHRLARGRRRRCAGAHAHGRRQEPVLDRKSTRLNSSHSQISYAVFCLKKKKKKINDI